LWQIAIYGFTQTKGESLTKRGLEARVTSPTASVTLSPHSPGTTGKQQIFQSSHLWGLDFT
jgi:hypothetical protein